MPEAVTQIEFLDEFLEWTDANHLRHTEFGLRDDKDPRKVVRET